MKSQENRIELDLAFLVVHFDRGGFVDVNNTTGLVEFVKGLHWKRVFGWFTEISHRGTTVHINRVVDTKVRVQEPLGVRRARRDLNYHWLVWEAEGPAVLRPCWALARGAPGRHGGQEP